MGEWNTIDSAPKDGTEIWAKVLGWESFYEVSSHGRVRSVDRTIVRRDGSTQFWRARILRRMLNAEGYLAVRLSDAANGRRLVSRVHRLVATAFIPNPAAAPEVNHKDGNKQNANVENLEWVDCSGNRLHARDTGLLGYAKLGADAARQIRRRAAHGEGKRHLAREFGVSPKTVRQVIAHQTWANLPPPPKD